MMIIVYGFAELHCLRWLADWQAFTELCKLTSHKYLISSRSFAIPLSLQQFLYINMEINLY